MSSEYSFRIVIYIEDYCCDVMINGIPVIRNYSGNQISSTVAVNQFILNGPNVLSSDIFVDASSYGPVPSLDVKLQATNKKSKSDWFTVAELQSKGKLSEGELDSNVGSSKLGTYQSSIVSIDANTEIGTISRDINIVSNLPDWGWKNSKKISKDSIELESLSNSYTLIHNLLKVLSEGELSGINDLRGVLSELILELSLAFNISAEDVFKGLKLVSTATDNEFSLMPFNVPSTYWETEIVANGKLVRMYPPDRDDLLAFIHESGFVQSFDFWFRYDGNVWRPVR